MLRMLCLALMTAAPGAAMADRVLSGRLTYPERIALPEGAEVVVEVRGIDAGVVAVQTLAAPGVPAAFAVTVPETGLVVTLGLRHDGRMIRAAPTQVLSAGTQDVELGPMVAQVVPGFGVRAGLACGPAEVTVTFADGGAHMRWGGEAVDMSADSAGPGQSFTDRRTPPSSLRLDGPKITAGLRGVDLDCQQAVPAFTLQGGGNEPGWQVRVGPDAISYTGDYGAVRRSLSGPVTTPMPDGWLYAAGDPPMAVLAQHGPAFDDATGMPYPWRLTVLTGDTILTGVGGAPEALLLGEWWFEDPDGQGVPDGPPATLRFDAEGRVAGHGGCNRFSGTYGLTGEGLRFGPLASTRMACAPAAMDQRHRVLDVLSRTDRFGIDDSGTLILYAADAAIARLRR